jgi:hypothetical protein
MKFFVFDYNQLDYFKIFDFMKKYRGWTKFEMDDMNPYELETFYFMALKDYKEEKGIK